MGEAGKKDKGKKEQRKKPKLTIKEKRKQKHEKVVGTTAWDHLNPNGQSKPALEAGFDI